MIDAREEAVARAIAAVDVERPLRQGSTFTVDDMMARESYRDLMHRFARAAIAALPTGEEALREALLAGTLSLSGNVVRIDFATREDAEAMFDLLTPDYCGFVEVGEDWNDPADEQDARGESR